MFPTLALSKSGYGSKRNYASSQPVFSSSPLFIKTLFNRYYSLAYRKMQENFSAGKKKGGFHMLFKKSGKI